MDRWTKSAQAICRRLTVSGVLGGEIVLGSEAVQEIEQVLSAEFSTGGRWLYEMAETYCTGGPFPEADVAQDVSRLIFEAEKVPALEAEVARLQRLLKTLEIGALEVTLAGGIVSGAVLPSEKIKLTAQAILDQQKRWQLEMQGYRGPGHD